MIHHDAHSYLIVCRGQQSSSGYSVTITDVVRQGHRIVVTASRRDPAAGEAVLTALTYPTAVARIPRTDVSVDFRFVRGP